MCKSFLIYLKLNSHHPAPTHLFKNKVAIRGIYHCIMQHFNVFKIGCFMLHCHLGVESNKDTLMMGILKIRVEILSIWLCI